ncbi:hypothetical protein N2152v2_009418 [Parachlorella kessleri]
MSAPYDPLPVWTDPHVLVSSEWLLQADAAGQLLSKEADYFVVGVLGGVEEGSLGKCPPFKVTSLQQRLLGQHCTSGIQIRASEDGIIALDTQPLFSLSLLTEVTKWSRPALPLAAPAVAAAGATKANVVPFEGAQRLMELQMGALLLSVCHLVVIFCDGLEDPAMYEYLQTVEMLARGIPDPSLPHLPPTAVSGTAASAGSKQPAPAQQQHLADVLLLHIVDPGDECGGSPEGAFPADDIARPSLSDVVELEDRVRAAFAASRLRVPGPISLLGLLQQHAAGSTRAPGPSSSASGLGCLSYWVLPRHKHDAPAGAKIAAGTSVQPSAPQVCGIEEWRDALIYRLLWYPRRAFARNVSQQGWGAGIKASWEAVCKSRGILEYYTRVVGTALKGAGGWGLAR